MRWEEISLIDDKDVCSPSPYLKAAHRVMAQPASVNVPPTIDVTPGPSVVAANNRGRRLTGRLGDAITVVGVVNQGA
jgi:hypothetical protein